MQNVRRLPEGSGRNPWLELANNRDHKFAPLSELKESFDYVIIGAGFGGISAAARLSSLKPGASIAVIDAFKVGFYSSGRNAGFISKAQIAKAMVGIDRFTFDDQKWLLRLNNIVVDRIEQTIKDHDLKVEYRRDGMYKAVREDRNVKVLDELASFFDKLGVKYEHLGQSDLPARLGTSFYKAALYLDETILDNPAELIRGLATALPANVRVFENVPVIGVTGGAQPEITLADGQVIKTSRVILTVNSFIKEFAVADGHTANVTAIHSFAGLTRPLNDSELKDFAGVKPWGITATHPAGATLRFTPQKRIFVRTDIAFATYPNINPERLHKAERLLRRAFVRRFPKLEHVDFEYTYGGLISFTANSQSLFGEVGQNVYAGTTAAGWGVTNAAILGNFLADLIAGEDSEELRYIKDNYHPSYLPPEPLRTVGARGALWLKDLTAGSEV
ncbi:MAG: FAD-binding oxidoreductase [Succinivibrio sp.]|nr:FAD-binding oxidoreductase [Succinivibrio sp.]